MERKAKMTTILFLTFTLMTLTLVSVPAVSAKTLKFNEVIYSPGLDPLMPGIQPQDRSADWSGPLTGDIVGTAYFWETDKNFVTGAGVVGKVEHFFEDFLIVFSDGGWIIGHEKQGIFTFKDFTTNSAKYHAEGPITAASTDKTSFIGCKFFEKGIVYFGEESWTGYGSGYIGP